MKENTELSTKSVKDLTPAVCESESVGLFLDTVQFDQGFRAARLLSESKGLIPKEYEGNPGNCMLALNMAKSLGLTMQAFFNWTYPVNGRLGLEAKAIVTIANQSGMFARGIEFEEIGSPADGDAWGFRAFAEDKRYGTIISETFTLGDAKAAGWINNTWWKKLPGMMMKYRSASFLIKLNRPELLGGLDVFEELRDEAISAPSRYKDITSEVEEVKPETKKPRPKKRKQKTEAPEKPEKKPEDAESTEEKSEPQAAEAENEDGLRESSYLIQLKDWIESDEFDRQYLELVNEETLTEELLNQALADETGNKAFDILMLIKKSK